MYFQAERLAGDSGHLEKFRHAVGMPYTFGIEVFAGGGYAPVISTGRRNTLVKFFSRCFKLQCFSGPFV